MHVAACDDNELFLLEIKEKLGKIKFIEEISLFPNIHTFLFSIDGGKRYDAILMDIDWGQEGTGIDAAEELFRLCPATKIIYVTGYNERFSQQIFLQKSNLSGFLTKPVDQLLLESNLRKVLNDLPFQEEQSLVLRQRNTPISIPIREIFYIESRGHTVEIHSRGEPIVIYEKLDSVMQRLPPGFFRCHKSYIVNLHQIRRFQTGEVILKNNEAVPVSRSRYAESKQVYFSFMAQSL